LKAFTWKKKEEVSEYVASDFLHFTESEEEIG
jgi:hypothetical protein